RYSSSNGYRRSTVPISLFAPACGKRSYTWSPTASSWSEERRSPVTSTFVHIPSAVSTDNSLTRPGSVRVTLQDGFGHTWVTPSSLRSRTAFTLIPQAQAQTTSADSTNPPCLLHEWR